MLISQANVEKNDQFASELDGTGAHERNRTFDLFLTKEVLYRLSYVSGETKTYIQWSGIGESNSCDQFGKLRFYH
jgi:hypothetical protein